MYPPPTKQPLKVDSERNLLLNNHLLQLGKHVEVVFTPFPPNHVVQR